MHPSRRMSAGRVARSWLSVYSLIALLVGIEAASLRNRTKRSFAPESCALAANLPNKEIFAATLTELCEFCGDMFERPPLVGQLCWQDCFGSQYVPACLAASCQWDEKAKYQRMVEAVSGKEFAVWHYDGVVLAGDPIPERLRDVDRRGRGDRYCADK